MAVYHVGVESYDSSKVGALYFCTHLWDVIRAHVISHATHDSLSAANEMGASNTQIASRVMHFIFFLCKSIIHWYQWQMKNFVKCFLCLQCFIIVTNPAHYTYFTIMQSVN